MATRLAFNERKWFRSVDKYGRRQPSLIITAIASFPTLLDKLDQNLAYRFLSTSKCVRPKLNVTTEDVNIASNSTVGGNLSRLCTVVIPDQIALTFVNDIMAFTRHICYVDGYNAWGRFCVPYLALQKGNEYFTPSSVHLVGRKQIC